jgi:hypothetical protein
VIKGRQIPEASSIGRLLDIRCDELKELAERARRAGLDAHVIEEARLAVGKAAGEFDRQAREAFVAARKGELPE